ncbi:MAG: hypothetical protein U1E59_04670 [Amaricoccus sp.]
MSELVRIVYTACALANPAVCEEHVIATAPTGGELGCLSGAQGAIAGDLLPGWRVVRFGCRRWQEDARNPIPLPPGPTPTPTPVDAIRAPS